MLFVGTPLGTLVLRLVPHSEHAALNAIVVLANSVWRLCSQSSAAKATSPTKAGCAGSVASACSSSGCCSSSATWAKARRRLRDRGRDLDGVGSYQQD